MKLLIIIFLGLIIPCKVFPQQFFIDNSSNLPSSAIGGNTMDAVITDLNGDNFPDIILAKEWQRNRLMFNDGAGNFTDVTVGNFTNINNDSEDITVADFDGNGWKDIVFATEDNQAHEMYLNTSNGNFIDVSERIPPFISNAVVSADFNGDTFPDLLFGNQGQNMIFINNGIGFFTDETATRLPIIDDVTQDLLLVDVDNDNDLDVLVGNEGESKILINNGLGIFTDQTATRLPQSASMETRKIITADVNGDNYKDLFFCNMASVVGMDVRDRLYLNNGNGVFTDVTGINIPFVTRNTFDAVFTNLNNDNHPDLIVSYIQNFMPNVYINNGSGVFTAALSSSYFPNTAANSVIALAMGDLNNDNSNDIYFGKFQQNDKMFFANPALNNNLYEISKNILIYPNPTENDFTIDFSNSLSADFINLSISNTFGQVVFNKQLPFENIIQFSTSDLASGLYVISIEVNQNLFKQKMIVK